MGSRGRAVGMVGLLLDARTAATGQGEGGRVRAVNLG